MTKDRFLRMIIPSVPVLSRTPLASVLDFADYFIKRNSPDWKALPPASLRMRIGVGNKILRNHNTFIESGTSIVNELSSKGYLNNKSSVMELGCGCGRNAIAFSNYLSAEGKYVGFDVDQEMIDWCKNNLVKNNMIFDHANIFSKVYNPNGMQLFNYKFPANNSTINLIVSISVFSHLLHADTKHYIQESARVLVSGGYLHMTLFLMDYLEKRLGDRWTFKHKLDKCYVDSLRYPEAAVAYDLSTLKTLFSSSGFEIVDIYNLDQHQQTVIAKKI